MQTPIFTSRNRRLTNFWTCTEMDFMDTHASTKALMNPLVLNLVFPHMDAPTLKSARSVCTLWADLGAAFLAKLTSVTFTTENCCRVTNSNSYKELASLHPKLARSVELIMVPSPCGWTSLPKNLIANLPHVSYNLVEFDVAMSSKFVPTLEHMWRTYHFPSLRRLTLTVIMIEVERHFQFEDVDVFNYNDSSEDEDDNYDENYGHINEQDEPANNFEFIVMTPKIPQFLTLPNLEFLKIVVKDINEQGQDDGVSSICQGLLNSASSVVNVDIKATFYPDFTPCTKLEKLTYTFAHFDDSLTQEEIFADIPALTEMLDKCRNYLTSLTLSGKHDLNEIDPENFMLPSIPNLTVLNVKQMYPLGNFLHRDNLPNLTHVIFSGYNLGYLCLADIFQNFNLTHERITSLDVEVFYGYFGVDVETAAKIVRLFPSVKNFRLKLNILADGEEEPNVTEMLQSFAPWDLKSGLVEIESDEDSTDVLAVLRGVVGWKDLSRTAVKFEVKESPKFVLDDEMEEIMLSCRSLRWIKMSGFQMEEEGRDRFEEFIEEHALSISLLNWTN